MKIETLNVRIELEDERGMSDRHARINVFAGGKLVDCIEAVIEPQQGADGGWYRTVVFRKALDV